MNFLEVSVKDDINIKESFELLIEEIINSANNEAKKKTEKTIHPSSKKKCCIF